MTVEKLIKWFQLAREMNPKRKGKASLINANVPNWKEE